MESSESSVTSTLILGTVSMICNLPMLSAASLDLMKPILTTNQVRHRFLEANGKHLIGIKKAERERDVDVPINAALLYIAQDHVEEQRAKLLLECIIKFRWYTIKPR